MLLAKDPENRYVSYLKEKQRKKNVMVTLTKTKFIQLYYYQTKMDQGKKHYFIHLITLSKNDKAKAERTKSKNKQITKIFF